MRLFLVKCEKFLSIQLLFTNMVFCESFLEIIKIWGDWVWLAGTLHSGFKNKQALAKMTEKLP